MPHSMQSRGSCYAGTHLICQGAELGQVLRRQLHVRGRHILPDNLNPLCACRVADCLLRPPSTLQARQLGDRLGTLHFGT
jgi:hypothetical protein